jgi:hypothetical protein
MAAVASIFEIFMPASLQGCFCLSKRRLAALDDIAIRLKVLNRLDGGL